MAFNIPFISGCCVLLPGRTPLLPVVLGPGLVSNSSLLFHNYSPGLSLKLTSRCQVPFKDALPGMSRASPETGAPRPHPTPPHPSSWDIAVHVHQEHLETNYILTMRFQGWALLKIIQGPRARYHGHVVGEKGTDRSLSSQGPITAPHMEVFPQQRAVIDRL